MNRRKVIHLLGGATIAFPLGVRAQERFSLPLVGWLHAGAAAAYTEPLKGFHDGLAELGFTDGMNVMVEYHWAEGKVDTFPSIAADLVSRKARAIVALEYPGAVQSALHATTTIPIIFGTDRNPVDVGFVADLDKPTGNATGVTYFSPTLVPKRVELLSQVIAPSAAIGYMGNRANPLTPEEANRVVEAGRQLGRTVQTFDVASDAEIEPTITKAKDTGVGGIILGSDPFFTSRLKAVAEIAIKHGIPMLSAQSTFPAAGGLLGYGVNKTASWHDIGRYVGKVLKGTKVADLPIVQPTKFDLAINLKTAKALGLTIPQALIAAADQVIS